MKNFNPDEIGIISVEKNRLPFKSDIKVAKIPTSFTVSAIKQMIEALGGTYEGDAIKSYSQLSVARYSWICQTIKKAKTKSIVIDDSQYLLSNELFERSKEKGYDKFTDLAVNFRNLIHFVNDLNEEDKIVYFFHHTDIGNDGREKMKTIGKMLEEKLTIEGCFDIVIFCKDHKFFTQSNEQSTAKTPEDMFELEIPNDLKAVDEKIREYYGL